MSAAPGLRTAWTHTALFYAAMFGALGAHLPFWPVWLQDWGLSPGEVGLYVSLGVAARAVAGLGLPMIADRLGQRRLTLALLCTMGAALVAGHLLIDTRLPLALASVALGALISGIMPLGEALGAGAALRFGFAYAPPRSVGSIAFLIASLATGALVARFGADAVVWWMVVTLAASAALAIRHPGAGSHAGEAPPGFGDIFRLLTEPTFALFVLASALCLSSHAVLYAYGSVHWRALGLSEDVIGALWAFSVAVEVGVMLIFGARLMDRLGPIGALVLSAVGGIVRWGLMMFDPTGPLLWVLQIGHSFTFVAGHLGAIAFIARAVPERYGATAQGAFMGLGGGILTAVAMVAAALLYPTLGGLTYGLALGMSAAGLACTLLLGRVWRGRVLAV